MGFTSKQKMFIEAAKAWAEKHGKDLSHVYKHDLQTIANLAEMKFPHWITRVPTYKVDRGLWMVPVDGAPAIKAVADSSVGVDKAPESVSKDGVEASNSPLAAHTTAFPTPSPSSVVEMTKGSTSTVTNIPSKDPLFVPFGNFSDVHSIIKSNMFYPIYVTGLSGNGKTFMIEQAAAKAGREMFRVNITVETDEDDLLGGFPCNQGN